MSRAGKAGAALLAAVGTVLPASAQEGAQEGARGVTVLRAQAPAPADVATPPVAAPVAAPVAKPAVTAAPAPPPPAPGRPTSPMLAGCARPFAQPAVTLGTGGFDKTLSASLKRKPASAVVDLPQPFAVGTDMPAALTPWLDEVKASGGIVSASEYCRDSRGLFGWLGRMIRGVRGSPYKAADGYDAVLHVDGLDQKVTQVEFKRRAQ